MLPPLLQRDQLRSKTNSKELQRISDEARVSPHFNFRYFHFYFGVLRGLSTGLFRRGALGYLFLFTPCCSSSQFSSSSVTYFISAESLDLRPNHALQRTATLAFSYRSAAGSSTGSVTACAPAMKPSTCRAFASRRRAHERALGSRSLSLGSLGIASRTV